MQIDPDQAVIRTEGFVVTPDIEGIIERMVRHELELEIPRGMKEVIGTTVRPEDPDNIYPSVL